MISPRNLSCEVTWKSAQDDENDENQVQVVELNTLVAFTSPLIAAASKGNKAAGAGPRGTDTGYEGRHGETPMTSDGHGPDRAEDDVTRGLDSRFGITDVLRYSNGHVQVRIPDPNCPSVDSTDTRLYLPTGRQGCKL